MAREKEHRANPVTCKHKRREQHSVSSLRMERGCEQGCHLCKDTDHRIGVFRG